MKYSFRDINGAVQTVDYENVGNKAFNVDSMVALKETPDKFYELCICDPPYGIGISSNPVRQAHTKKDWDKSIPNTVYFAELMRVSKNQIIWVGSASSIIACLQSPLNLQYIGFEIDEEYFNLASKRIADHKAQMTIFEVM